MLNLLLNVPLLPEDLLLKRVCRPVPHVGRLLKIRWHRWPWIVSVCACMNCPVCGACTIVSGRRRSQNVEVLARSNLCNALVQVGRRLSQVRRLCIVDVLAEVLHHTCQFIVLIIVLLSGAR